MRVHKVLGVEIPVGEASLIAAEKSPYNIAERIFVFGNQGAVIKGEIEQPVIVVGRIGIELEKRVSERGGRVAQVAADQKQAGGLHAVEKRPR